LKGLGTGFVVEKDGVVLTNNHVIEGADQITVKLSDEREFQARIVGRDASTDIAVLKIEAKDLVALSLGDSEGIEVGDWVVAIGNPFGLSHTVSAGIISAKGRTREDVPLDPSGYYDFLQTDASINPGNSGGPLLDMKSEVVGINTAIRGGGAQGIGFAIPINMVKQLLPMLMRDGHVTRSAMGVRIRDVRELSPDDRAALKLIDEKGAPLVQSGAVIEFVAPGGPADRAGLSPGDVILAFEGTTIERGTQLQWVASTYGVGKQANVRVARDGKRFDVKVTLGQLPDAPTKARGGALPPGFGPPPR
jgi:serine protease Do